MKNRPRTKRKQCTVYCVCVNENKHNIFNWSFMFVFLFVMTHNSLKYTKSYVRLIEKIHDVGNGLIVFMRYYCIKKIFDNTSNIFLISHSG